MITKAIIPVAGWGTRRLPITKTIEKSMLPIGNRPLVDYIVQDCVDAGITDIYFVVSTENSQLEQYYGRNAQLEDYLVANNKSAMLPLVQAPPVNFHYVVQELGGKYGTAIPVALCAPFIGEGESVVVLMGDDFIYAPDEPSQVRQLVDNTPVGASSILGFEIDPSQVGKFGIINRSWTGQYLSIVEKPAVGQAPSNLANISKYLVNPALMAKIVEYAGREDVNGEYYIIEAFNEFVAADGHLQVIPARGYYADGGSLDSWLDANNVILGKK